MTVGGTMMIGAGGIDGLMCFHIILANLKLPYGSIKPVYAY